MSNMSSKKSLNDKIVSSKKYEKKNRLAIRSTEWKTFDPSNNNYKQINKLFKFVIENIKTFLKGVNNKYF